MKMLELNKIHNMDAFKGLAALDDNSVGLILTSPPFKDEDIGVGKNNSGHRIKDPDSGDKYYIWLDKLLKECFRVSPITLMFNSSTRLIDICNRYDPVRILIWDKIRSHMSYRYEPIFVFAAEGVKVNGGIWNDCLRELPIMGNKQLVPYQNPLKLYETLIRFFPKAQLVCDPFMGSGTTAAAAKKQDRDFIGFEVIPEYAAMATERAAEPITSKLETFGG